MKVHNQTFKCPTCDRSFKGQSNLKKHCEVVHNDISKYECDICEKTFKRDITLRRHVESIHDRNRKFKCELCGKGYPRNVDLNCHISKEAFSNATFVTNPSQEKLPWRTI